MQLRIETKQILEVEKLHYLMKKWPQVMDHLFKYAQVETRSGEATLLKNYEAAASVASNVEGRISNLPCIIITIIDY